MGPAMGATGTKAHGAIGGEPSREDSVNPSPPPTNGDKPTPAARMRALVSAAAAIATSSKVKDEAFTGSQLDAAVLAIAGTQLIGGLDGNG
mmetsp:Transcript_87423/g.121327  ORF Transcript_87423/g.121327 Transcript_87423/m.121327 type:complete len:91 (+) Transcript_87423:483-755(+)